MSTTKRTSKKASRNRETDLNIDLLGVVDNIEDELMVIDSGHRIRFANSAVRGRFEEEGDWLVDRFCYEVFQKRDRPCASPLWACPLREVLKSGRERTVIHYERLHKTEKYVKITAHPLRDSDGEIKAVLELRRDVTAERVLETEILRRHHRLLALSQISGAVCGLWDLEAILRIALDNVLDIVSGGTGGILLLDEKSGTLQYRVQRGLSAKYTDEVSVKVGEGIAGRVVQTGEPMLLEDISKDPRSAHPDLISAEGLKAFISIPLKSKGNVVGVMNVASHSAGRFGSDDLTLLCSISDYLGTAIEQASLYGRLAKARERYQALLRHSLTAQEEERKRIARELHDETSQALTTLSLNLQAIIEMTEMKGINDPELLNRLKTTHSYTIHAGNEIVKLMKELRPTLLDELGLPSAIHRYAKDNLQSQGINVSAEFNGMDERLEPEVEVTLFRIAQGAIGNILEHSGAKNAFIKLDCSTGQCELNITDDGKGFDVNKLTRVDSRGRGAGLFTMMERAGMVGGSCQAESRPGRGTEIVVKIPVGRNKADE